MEFDNLDSRPGKSWNFGPGPISVTYVCTPQTYYYTDLNYEFEVGILS